MSDPTVPNPIYSSRLAKALLVVLAFLYFLGAITSAGVILLSERDQNPQRLRRMMTYGVIEDSTIFVLCLLSFVLIVRRYKNAVAFTVLAMFGTMLIVSWILWSHVIRNGFQAYDLIEVLFVLPSCVFILTKTGPLR